MTTIVYIMGHGFSGSTLLTLLLGAHPAIATVGETEVIADKAERGARLCSCRVPFNACSFWRRVSDGMAARGQPFDVLTACNLDFRAPGQPLTDRLLRVGPRAPLLEACRRFALERLPTARRRLDKLLQRNLEFVTVVTGLKGAEVFVDASKRPERALHLREMPGARVKVVHLVRDGRAVASSSMKNLGVDAAWGARSWLSTNQACERARRRFSAEDWLFLRYEDLCDDPTAGLAELHRFIGVAEQPPAEGFQDGQHVIGNRMRLSHAREIRRDERWRSTLNGGDRMAVQTILGDLNQYYGYAT